LQRFVIGFFFASAGVQTVILIASLFGTEVLHLETGALITTIILIQFVGIIGAQLFAYLSGRIGNMRALLVAAALWAVICFLAFLVQTEMQFYLLGSSLGLVLGGIQALARSTFAKMLPDGGEHVTYFSFFDIAEKLATVMGMLGVGWIIETTGDMRISALLLSVFFVIAVVVWFPIQFRQSKQIREK
ncbi:MAG: MFS transporter, partial [Flavobacteriales bacterium]|nr:MFS transporter [Flavobacteriales bacterium]